MTKRIVYAVRPLRTVRGAHEAVVEYMPGYVKGFVGPNRRKLFAEIDEALDNKVPTLSGKVEVIDGES